MASSLKYCVTAHKSCGAVYLLSMLPRGGTHSKETLLRVQNRTVCSSRTRMLSHEILKFKLKEHSGCCSASSGVFSIMCYLFIAGNNLENMPSATCSIIDFVSEQDSMICADLSKTISWIAAQIFSPSYGLLFC